MAKRVIKLTCGDTPKQGLSLLPYGAYLNAKVDKAIQGSILMLGETWRKQKRVLVRKCKVALNTSVGNFLIRHLYGENARIEEIAERWRAECIVEGLGKNAFGDEVWLLETLPFSEELEELNDELNEIETCIEQTREQIEARKAELEKMLADARRGVFNHPDIIS